MSYFNVTMIEVCALTKQKQNACVIPSALLLVRNYMQI